MCGLGGEHLAGALLGYRFLPANADSTVAIGQTTVDEADTESTMNTERVVLHTG